jgi:hypothetical protein
MAFSNDGLVPPRRTGFSIPEALLSARSLYELASRNDSTSWAGFARWASPGDVTGPGAPQCTWRS